MPAEAVDKTFELEQQLTASRQRVAMRCERARNLVAGYLGKCLRQPKMPAQEAGRIKIQTDMHSQLPSSPLVRVSGNLRVIWKTFLSDTLLMLEVVEPELVLLHDAEIA